MIITTVSSREFNQDASGAKRAASKGPVIITDRGRPAHVLLTIEAYRKLTQKAASIADLWPCPVWPTSPLTPRVLAASHGQPI
jgi:prevent-host-death family protein